MFDLGFEEMVDLDAKNIVNASKENAKGILTFELRFPDSGSKNRAKLGGFGLPFLKNSKIT